MSKPFPTLPLAALALVAMPAAAQSQAQNYGDLPPLAPMPEAQVRALPADMQRAPAPVQTGETVTTVDGVETITRTRRIDTPRPAPAAPEAYAVRYLPDPAAYAAQSAYVAPAYAPVVFEREQWLDECRRRTRGQDRDGTGLIIGGLLGAIAGGVVGYEIAGVGSSLVGAGGGGLLGGLLGSLFDGDDEDRYDCEAALDAYLKQYGAPPARIASREIPYPGYGYATSYPAAYPYGYGYAYAPQQQMVMVPVRTEVQQQVVVRESVREETYPAPGATRIIPEPAPRPSPKMIRQR